MNRNELVKRLELVKPALSEGLAAIFGCYMFSGNYIAAWDGSSLGIVAPFDRDKKAPDFALNGKILLGLLKSSSAKEVDLSLGDTDANLTAGKSHFSLPYLKKDAFLFEEPESELPIQLGVSERLIDSIRICRTTSATDHTQPALMGLCFALGEGFLYSSEGDIITRIDLGGASEGCYVAPNAFCDAVLKIWEELDNKKCMLEFNDEWIRASFDEDYTVYGRLIKGKVEYAKIIDKTLKGKAPSLVSLPEGFGEALAQARVLTDAETKPTYLQVSGGSLGIHSESSHGMSDDDLPFDHEDTGVVGIHAQLAERSIKVCTKMALKPNCTVYGNSDGTIFQIVGNAK